MAMDNTRSVVRIRPQRSVICICPLASFRWSANPSSIGVSLNVGRFVVALSFMCISETVSSALKGCGDCLVRQVKINSNSYRLTKMSISW